MAKKMSGAADYIVPIGIIALIGFALYKMGIFSGTATGTGSNSAATTSNTTAVTNAAFTASAAQVAQSMPDTTLNTMISTMFSDYLSSTSLFSGSSYEDDIVSQMSNVNNITDLYRLMQLFGTRAMPDKGVNLCNTIDLACPQVDFGTFIHNALDAAHIADLNSVLSGNGIQYTFS
jgi:hypothetical protein